MLAGRPVPHLITKCSLASCPAKRKRPIVAERPESRISHSSSGDSGGRRVANLDHVGCRQRLAVDACFVDVTGEAAMVVARGRVVVHDARAAGAEQEPRRAVGATDADRLRARRSSRRCPMPNCVAVEISAQPVGCERRPSESSVTTT